MGYRLDCMENALLIPLTEADTEILRGRPGDSGTLFCGRSGLASGLCGVNSSLVRVITKKREVSRALLSSLFQFFIQ